MKLHLLAACLGLVASAPPALASTCATETMGIRNVLLELYTSEGCDSCPPADQRLSWHKQAAPSDGRLVPLAFHVDYWDRLGWTDRFGSPRHTERQRNLAGLAGSRQIYTPQFMRNGRDWRGGGDPLAGLAATPAEARLRLRFAASATLTIEGEAELARPGLEAWLAIYEHNLTSQVRAGENAGRTLRHDYVVRQLIGPLAPDHAGRVALRQTTVAAKDWKRADLGVVAFVQDRATGEVVQALQRHACPD